MGWLWNFLAVPKHYLECKLSDWTSLETLKGSFIFKTLPNTRGPQITISNKKYNIALVILYCGLQFVGYYDDFYTGLWYLTADLFQYRIAWKLLWLTINLSRLFQVNNWLLFNLNPWIEQFQLSWYVDMFVFWSQLWIYRLIYIIYN